jgi:hypothetical protein
MIELIGVMRRELKSLSDDRETLNLEITAKQMKATNLYERGSNDEALATALEAENLVKKLNLLTSKITKLL